jgi:3-oxoadipate enol-lactonase
MQNVSVTGTGFIDIPGVRLAHDMAGRGSPVVFLHGGLLDRRMWDGQFAFFARESSCHPL